MAPPCPSSMRVAGIAQAPKDTFAGKRVLVRVDFNVPQGEDGGITDDSRIKATLPTLRLLVQNGARIILVSHLGRPKGPAPSLTLAPVAEHLAKLLKQPVRFASGCIESGVYSLVNQLENGEVCLLENVRFYPEEERNDPKFAQKLAGLADVYVNDAFGTAHRAHASTCGVANYLKPRLAGLLMSSEIEALSSALNNPARPFATVIGGAKVSSKIGVLKNLVPKVDTLVVGGAMAFSFLKAQGKNVGRSLVEPDKLDFCRQLMDEARAKRVEMILPVDIVAAKEIKPGIERLSVPVDGIPADMMGLDVGPHTSGLISAALRKSNTILWNGPLGVFETKGFETGTYRLIDDLVEAGARGAKTVVGGGDSVLAIEAHGTSPESFSHVSTGGGASLEFLEGVELPGIACLDKAL